MEARHLILASIALLIAASCGKNNPADGDYELETLTFTASMDSPVPFEWAADDKIAVFDGSARNVFSISEGSISGKSASFTGTVRKGATDFTAVFPADAAASDGSFAVPGKQTVSAGKSFDNRALASKATASGRAFSFSFKEALVQITIPEEYDGKLSSIVLEGAKDERLSSGGKVTLISGADAFPAGNYYIGVTPASLSGGFIVRSVTKGASTGTVKKEEPVNFTASGITSLGDVVSGATWETVLMTKEQLLAWNSDHESWSEDDTVRLGADIDMSDADGWTAHEGFCGVFDGQGHRIYNFTVRTDADAAFIGSVTGNGVVKNVVFGTKDGEKFDGRSIFRHEKAEKADGWFYVAPVGRLLDNASVSGIENFALCENGKDDLGSTHVGGIVALSDGIGNIEDCINRGDVRNIADTSRFASASIGGIVGRVNGTMEVKNCSNFGTVTTENAYVAYVGGIAGQLNGEGKAVTPVVIGCKNFGAVQNVNTTRQYYTGSPNSNTSVIQMLAGIVGENDGGSIISCENSGTISSMHGNGQCMMAGIVARYRNAAGEDGCVIENCINQESGTVSFEKPGTWFASMTATHVVAGILANIPYATVHGLTIRGCRNYAVVTSSHPQTMAAGGIGGYLNGGQHILTIEDCHNYGPVSLECTRRIAENSNEAYCGGILAWFDPAKTEKDVSKVSGCTNSAPVSAVKYAKLMLGGIVGRSRGLLISGCENTGDVTDKSPYTDWRAVGGIVGRNQSVGDAYPESVIENCTNSGKVSVLDSKCNNPMTAAGGILGAARPRVSLSGCVNRGDVTVETGGKYAYAGGIWGYEGENPGACEGASLCKNYGIISASISGEEALGIGAGGITGYAGTTTDYAKVEGNYTFGDVWAKVAGEYFQAAGALVGRSLAVTSMASAYVSKGIKVNGVPYGEAQSQEGWLCGTLEGTMTFDNVTFIDGE